MDLPRMRGGVPVLSLWSSIPASKKLADNDLALKSPKRPPSVLFAPMCIRPRKKVPVVTTTVLAWKSRSRLVCTPTTAPFLKMSPVTWDWKMVRPSCNSQRCFIRNW